MTGSTTPRAPGERRRRAQQLREQRYDGIDPLQAKKPSRIIAKIEAAKALTFAACARDYISAHQAGWPNTKRPRNGRRS